MLLVMRISTAVALMLGASTSAMAKQIISTGPVAQNLDIECYVTNVGARKVTVNSVKIVNEEGTDLGTTFSSCNFPGDIFPGLGCVGSAPKGAGVTARCVVEVAGSAKTLRVHLATFTDPPFLFDSSESR